MCAAFYSDIICFFFGIFWRGRGLKERREEGEADARGREGDLSGWIGENGGVSARPPAPPLGGPRPIATTKFPHPLPSLVRLSLGRAGRARFCFLFQILLARGAHRSARQTDIGGLCSLFGCQN